MAWSLKREDSIEEYKLLTGKEYRVGRLDGDIVLDKDPSISRKHAVIFIRYGENVLANIHQLPVVTIKDFSKYGTKINDVKLDCSTHVLKSGDKIMFGIVANVWRIIYTPLVCSSSGLEPVEKSATRQLLTRIGGHLLPEWTSDCTHLIANKLTVTIKVINALVSQCPIVTIEYFKSYVKFAENKDGSLNCANFVPPIVETSFDEKRVNLSADARRKVLFRGKTFIVWNEKQLKKLRFTILAAGGEIQLRDPKSADGLNFTNMGDRELFVLKPANDEKLESRLNSCLLKEGHHLILEGVIGLSVLYCSTEVFEEPSLQTDLEDFSISSSFAFESQTPRMNSYSERSQRLPDTEPKESSIQTTKLQSYFKRPVENDQNSVKRIKIETPTDETNLNSSSSDRLDAMSNSKNAAREKVAELISRTPSLDKRRTYKNNEHEKEQEKKPPIDYRFKKPNHVVSVISKASDLTHKTEKPAPDESLVAYTPIGFLSSRTQDDFVKMEQDEYERKVFTNVKIQSLIENRRSSLAPSRTIVNNRAVRNFKKFQKVKTVKRSEAGEIKMSSYRSSEAKTNSNSTNRKRTPAADSDDSDSGNMFDF